MKELNVYLEHILESIIIIQDEYIKGVTKQKFLKDRQLQDAVIRRLEILGEAAKHISESDRETHKNIPWRSITGMRDVIVHEYFNIDKDVIWKTAKQHIKSVRKALEKYFAQIKK